MQTKKGTVGDNPMAGQKNLNTFASLYVILMNKQRVTAFFHGLIRFPKLEAFEVRA